MSSSPSLHPWSEEALFSKARLYIEQMESHASDDWQLGFWSSLSLELLARAAIAHISPVLLADAKDPQNLVHALGLEPTQKKFIPKSIPAQEVFNRLKVLVPTYSEEVSGFCAQHANRRNAELHSGQLAFANKPPDWLPQFYMVCRILLDSMGRRLSDFVSDEDSAQAMIASYEDDAAKAVEQIIKAHYQVWLGKDEDERTAASVRADVWAARQKGHRVNCPACGCRALIFGNPVGKVSKKIEGEHVIQKQAMLPSKFSCVACSLRIDGLSKLVACRLGSQFTDTSTYSPAEFFKLYTEEDLEEALAGLGPDDDFND